MADGWCRLHSPTLAVDTVENARAAGRRSGEVRRERRKSIRELIHEQLEADADLVYRDLRAAIDRGDRVGAFAITDRALGISELQAARIEAVQAMRARRSPFSTDDSSWLTHHDEFEEL